VGRVRRWLASAVWIVGVESKRAGTEGCVAMDELMEWNFVCGERWGGSKVMAGGVDEICEGGVLGGGDLGIAGDYATVFYV